MKKKLELAEAVVLALDPLEPHRDDSKSTDQVDAINFAQFEIEQAVDGYVRLLESSSGGGAKKAARERPARDARASEIDAYIRAKFARGHELHGILSGLLTLYGEATTFSRGDVELKGMCEATLRKRVERIEVELGRRVARAPARKAARPE